MLFHEIQLLDPACSSVQLSTGQPEPNLINGSKTGMQMQIDLSVHRLANLLSLLERSPCVVQISAGEANTYQHGVSPVEIKE
jgi:hypothetical protein